MQPSARRILVVDDEQSLLLTLAANLELEGFEVVAASSAQEALRLLEEGPFDLLLSDIRMPGMNGVELFERVRQLRPETPVLLMTAFAFEGLVQRAMEEGVFAVLSKPFKVDDLIRALSVALKRPLVLVVDDEVPVAETAAASLNEAGVRARALFDGEAALALVRSEAVDVCVVDLVMPNASGAELIRRLTELSPSIACIAVSGHDVPHLFRQAASQAYTFLRKPVPVRELAQTIAQARGRKMD